MCILHFPAGAKLSVEIPDLYLDFTKFTVEKVDSYTQIAPYILKNFPITESGTYFKKLKLITMKQNQIFTVFCHA